MPASDDDVIEQVRRIRDVVDVAAVEQPYDVGNVVDTARLAERLDVPVSIDEGIRSVRDVAQIVRYRAAETDLREAGAGRWTRQRAHDHPRERTRPVCAPYVGGFFESPYARRVHRWLANNCVDEPSDVGPVDVVLEGYDARGRRGRRGLRCHAVARDAASAPPFWWTSRWRFRLSP